MEFAEQLKGVVRIEDVVGEYVRLRKSGPSRYMGLCPFHSEKTPSFTVHVVHQFYKCFSCGAAGDVIKFVMEKEGLSFFEALKSLAERYGVPMPKRSQYADDDSRMRAALFEMHTLAAQTFRANLQSPAGDAARAYLERRGVSPETAEKFGLGYSERGRALVRLFGERRFTAEQSEQSGLVGKREDGSFYDRFRNRLMFPIHNEAGKIIGFGGRALDAGDEPKYLNSPETPIYKKSFVLYNLHRAKEAIRRDDRAILVEGYMDAIGVTAAGFASVVASCGTSLTAQQVQTLKRHSGKVFVNFDPDAAGANATERSIGLLLTEGMHVRIVELDRGLDPDEYCKQNGATAYADRLAAAKGYFYWLADRARTQHDVHSSEGAAAILQALLPAVERISDPIERSAVANDLAAYVGAERGAILDWFRKAAAARDTKPIEAPKAALRPSERILLNAVLQPEMRAEMLGELRSLDAVSRFGSHRIFQAVFVLEDAGTAWGFEELHARLEPADQNLLAEAVLQEDERNTLEKARAAIESVARDERLWRRDQLKARIREAERAGNMEEAIRLARELADLERAA
ncbi:MAG: DNA primase [Bryobacteraceae bacterium]|jgi:DNA primase